MPTGPLKMIENINWESFFQDLKSLSNEDLLSLHKSIHDKDEIKKELHAENSSSLHGVISLLEALVNLLRSCV